MTKLKNAIENYVTIRQFGRKHICLGGLWTLKKMANPGFCRKKGEIGAPGIFCGRATGIWASIQ